MPHLIMVLEVVFDGAESFFYGHVIWTVWRQIERIRIPALRKRSLTGVLSNCLTLQLNMDSNGSISGVRLPRT